jgi:RNA polymerase sigma-70 factor (ECF subfamily)
MDENATLIAAFCAELERPVTVDGTLLRRAVDAGRAEWPELALAPEAFARHLGRHFSEEEPPAPWLERVRAADLYLACACAEKVPGALDAFERRFLGAVPAILRRSGPRDVPADEISQRLRERLFVGDAKIADYAGRGSLGGWLEVVTLRVAMEMRRRDRLVLRDDSGEAAQIADADPELEFIKERYRGAFKQALRAALEALEAEQRNLLKLHFVDGVTLDQLAVLFHVHRATIARRIAAARAAVLYGVQERLRAELALDPDEFDGLLQLVQSRLELSLSALLP